MRSKEALRNEKKVLTLSELERAAFPDHPFSWADLLEFAYAEKTGELYPQELAQHIEGCDYCQRELAILKQIDPVLTGEEDSRVKVLMQAAENPVVARQVEERATKALTASVGDYGKGLVAFVSDLISSKRR
jgi:hypothetical protein